MVKKHNIVNHSNHRSKSDASVVLGDSEDIFLVEKGNAVFCIYCILFIYDIANRRSKSSNFFAWYFVAACKFSALNFCQYYVKFFLCKLS